VLFVSNFNAGSACAHEYAWNVDGHYKSASVMVTRAGGCVCAAGAGAMEETAAVPATTIKSHLAHSPLPHLTSLLASTGLPAGSTISQYRDMNSYDNRYGFFATI